MSIFCPTTTVSWLSTFTERTQLESLRRFHQLFESLIIRIGTLESIHAWKPKVRLYSWITYRFYTILTEIFTRHYKKRKENHKPPTLTVSSYYISGPKNNVRWEIAENVLQWTLHGWIIITYIQRSIRKTCLFQAFFDKELKSL